MIDINLLPWRERERKQQKQRQWLQGIAAACLSLLLLFLLHFALHYQIKAAEARQWRLQASIAGINQGLEEIRLLYQALDYQPMPEVDLNTLLNQQWQFLQHWQKLVEVLPEGVHLYLAQGDFPFWILDGAASTSDDILNFSNQLKNHFKFSSADEKHKNEKYLDITEKNQRYSFQLRLGPGL